MTRAVLVALLATLPMAGTAASLGCLASARPAPTGRPYRVVAAAFNGRAVTVDPTPGAEECTLSAGAQSGRFWITPAGATGEGPTVLTATESELLGGLALRCEGWSPPPQLGIVGPARRTQVVPDRTDRQPAVQPISHRELAEGHVVMDAVAPTSWGVPTTRFRLDLRLVPAAP